MNNHFFDVGTARVGGSDVAFERRAVLGDFMMYIPRSFCEDVNIVSNTSYFFSRDKSPLSIALKYTRLSEGDDRKALIDRYFSACDGAENGTAEIAENGIIYCETVASSRYMDIYSLRFSVEVEKGILFGCFICAANYRDDWKPVVLQMLQNIELA